MIITATHAEVSLLTKQLRKLQAPNACPNCPEASHAMFRFPTLYPTGSKNQGVNDMYSVLKIYQCIDIV